ncbi:hypothetical protein [Arthrobacter sp. Br18]|uniref:hypothetical protein n=1 Tax=Arthrobacter sp. Br18 TaxID=1312954 RepID=UPI00047C88BE|nr:hypothetical protein [Arthrobacter sp. Br18]
MVEALPEGALASRAAASSEYGIPATECCFTGCCERGKAFLLEQLENEQLENERLETGDQP